MYQQMYKHSNTNINVGNLGLVVVENNIATNVNTESDISV